MAELEIKLVVVEYLYNFPIKRKSAHYFLWGAIRLLVNAEGEMSYLSVLSPLSPLSSVIASFCSIASKGFANKEYPCINSFAFSIIRFIFSKTLLCETSERLL